MLALLYQFNLLILEFIQFIYHISWTYLIITTLIFSNLILFFNANTLITKLTWFFFILITCSSLVWFVSLETFGFILLLTELTIIFLFLIVITQFTTKLLQTKFYLPFYLTLSLLILCLQEFDTNITLNSSSYYSAMFLVITADYFFIYYFLIIYLDITAYVALILGLFSIYFILLFYQLKNLQQQKNKNIKSIYLLRKQNLVHQAIYFNYLRWFQ